MQVEPYAPKDRTFVLGGLVKGLATAPCVAGCDTATAARWAYGSAIRYLGRKSSIVYILTDGRFQAPRGFLAAETIEGLLTLHWVHVEPSWRRTGGANALLDLLPQPIIATNMTVPGRELLGSRRFEYVPHVWWSLIEPDDWKLANSSKHHERQFLAAAEWLSVDK